MSIKQAKSKAFKKGRKVGYWLAMQNIKKNKPELEVSDVKDVSVKPKPKPELEVSDVKDVSVKPKPKSELEVVKGIDYNYDYDYDPSKIVLNIEDLPSTNIESTAIETYDIGIQNDKQNEIDLAIEDALNQQDIIPYNPEDNYDPIRDDEIDYAFDLLNEDEEIQSEEIDYAWDILNEKPEIEIRELSEDEILDRELQRMIEQVIPEDPLPTPSEEAELFAMADY